MCNGTDSVEGKIGEVIESCHDCQAKIYTHQNFVRLIHPPFPPPIFPTTIAMQSVKHVVTHRVVKTMEGRGHPHTKDKSLYRTEQEIFYYIVLLPYSLQV